MSSDGPSPSAAPSSADNDATVGLARRLIYVLGLRDEDDYRLAVLKRVARRLQEDYPEFLRLLLLVACSHDVRARKRLANALDIGLRRNDLPSGRLSSWGAATPEAPGASGDTLSAGDLTNRFFKAPQRALGPLEYLAVWHHQRTQRTPLGREAYCFALSHLIELINADEKARERYVARLHAESERKIEGTYSGTTRQAMRRMAETWAAGEPVDSIADAAARSAEGGAGTGENWVIRPL